MPITDKLTSIANAIREKGGTTDKLTLDAMPNAIATLPSGGGSGDDGVPNPIEYTGDCSSLFIGTRNLWILENFLERIEIKKVSTASSMFMNNTALKLPAVSQQGSYTNWTGAFNGSAAREIGAITNFYPTYCNNMFQNCYYLRNCPEFINPKLFAVNSTGYNHGSMFNRCYSLRNVDEELMKCIQTKSTTSYNAYYNLFNYCVSLDEVKNINPMNATTMSMNTFSSTFNYCCRLKRITFALQENGTPYTVSWSAQTIDLSKYTGWAGAANSDTYILNYNSGITAADEDSDWSNNPNYWSKQFMNSRFNHTSAVELINTLPDASAYLEEKGSANNTIKFYTNAGSATPGGSVSALTEEEIAVAAAKGWSIGYTV